MLTLLLVGPVTAIAVATAMYFSPGSSQMFHATVQPGRLPVVDYTQGAGGDPMSLFGEVDDGDRRRKQQQKLQGLTELVKLGAKRKLPPLGWRIPDGYGTLSGNADPIAGTGDQHPRDTFEAWHDAIAKLPRVEPGKLGFRNDGAHRAEGIRDGKTWLIAVFKLSLAKTGAWPRCESRCRA